MGAHGGGKGKEARYKLVDALCLFFIRFVHEQNGLDERYWQKNLKSQKLNVWRGYAFENVCFNHVPQIKRALEIGGVSSRQSAWVRPGNEIEGGLQIDLIIERDDNVYNMCEIKFYNKEFIVSREYYDRVMERIDALIDAIPKNATVHSTLITTSGLLTALQDP